MGSETSAAPVTGREAARSLLRRLLSDEQAEPLEAVVFIQDMASELADGMQAAAQRARAAGRTWAEIGGALGMSRQAAFQRYGRAAGAAGTASPRPGLSVPDAAARGTALISDLIEGRWTEVRCDFGEKIARKLDVEGIATMWARLTGMLGGIERVGEPIAYQAADLTLAEVPLSFEAAERTARISYDADGKVVGLFFLPPGLA